jgi:F0F1-type ATP synthase assembly protein I
MIRFITGFMAGGFIGYLLGQIIPPEFFLIMSILLLFMAALLSVLFHIGLYSSLKE